MNADKLLTNNEVHERVNSLTIKALEEAQLVENNTTKTVTGARGVSGCIPHHYNGDPPIHEYLLARKACSCPW